MPGFIRAGREVKKEMKYEIPTEKCVFGKKLKLELAAQQSIGRVIDFAGRAAAEVSLQEMEDEAEVLTGYYYSIISSVENCVLPFWWEDYFSIETELKSLVTQIVIFINKVKLINERKGFDLLLAQEIRILERMKKYFSEIISDSGVASQEFIDETKNEIKKLYSSLTESLGTISDRSDYLKSLMVLEIFEKANQINGKIINHIQKINLGAAV